jgi:DNA-binding LacI/PurR family transcriptional regulator
MTERATARPTLSAVARRAGVSVSTASLAFSGAGPVADATRERVLVAAEELGYAGPDPRAASLRRGRSGIVGVVLGDKLRLAFRDPINIAMLDGLAEGLEEVGAAMLLLSGEEAQLASAAVDAVVLVGCSTGVAEAVASLHQRSLPVVAIEADPIDGVAGIDLDNREASAALARHLHELGHRAVSIVSLPLEMPHARRPIGAGEGEVHTSVQRILGVRDVFPDADGLVAAASSVDEGVVAGRVLLEPAARPTAIVAQSDLLAIGVIRAARELGIRVPEDLSVVGFDGVRLDGLADDDLTTMVQPATEKGLAAARAALAMVEGEAATHVAFESRLHVGATTSAPRS